jgi:hypothetical protein
MDDLSFTIKDDVVTILETGERRFATHIEVEMWKALTEQRKQEAEALREGCVQRVHVYGYRPCRTFHPATTGESALMPWSHHEQREAEIERLRAQKARTEEIFDEYQMKMSVELVRRDERIEELEADVRFYRNGDVQDSTDPVLLRQRIERLRSELEIQNDCIVGQQGRIEDLENTLCLVREAHYAVENTPVSKVADDE